MQIPALLVTLAIATTASASPAAATQPSSAQQILHTTLSAHGGAERIIAASGLSYELEGGFHAPLQAAGYRGPFEPLPFSARYVFDWAGKRSRVDSKLVFPGGFILDTRELGGKESIVLDQHRLSFSRDVPLGMTASAYRYHPLPLLRQLVQPDTTLSDGGNTEFFGRKAHRLQARWPGLATDIEVLVDQETKLLAGYRLPRSYPLVPTGTNSVRFMDYQLVDGVKVPAKVYGETLSTPRLGFEVRLRGQKLGAVVADEFVLPKGYIELAAESSLGPFVRELAPNVYQVERLGGQDYAAMVLVGTEGVTLVEAPLNDKASAQLLTAVDRIAPGKPIKTLVLTHHHDDHVGGMSAIVDRGATVLGPAGAEDTLKAIYAANRPGRTMNYIAVPAGKKHLLADTPQPVELYNINDNPHSEQILALYIPSEKLLFQADMFTNPVHQEAGGPANEGGMAFVRWIKAQGLVPERIAGVHGTIASRADINHMLKKAGSSLRL
ncbi:MBL fold metallo-hydrolase [Chitinimonas sp. BJYL2]|uniref:MBL fold metallo-hydrolase n=1 Tax=Chitinimonas sp. BJYL2 TaxID=2976696 RepID=UPI0022B4C5BD|nr:MBL fold metallo-hydrolase [Chitinimonas sp. BJYL2]